MASVPSPKPRAAHQESPDLGPFAMSNMESTMIMEFSPLSYQQAKGGKKRTINRHRSLGTLGVLAIIYFYGCGRPVGTEPLIMAGGPLVGLIAAVVYPLFMTLPYGWIVAELCSAFPEDGGFTIWVMHAFGPFWACQVGYWTWLSGTVFSAMVPTLFIDVFGPYMGISIASDWERYMTRVALATVLSIPSIFGTKCVSRLAIAFLVITLVPYLIFTVWAYTECTNLGVLLKIHHTESSLTDASQENGSSGSIDWKTLLNALFWNYNGINIASVFAGEVKNPSYVYSKAIFIAIAIVLAMATVVALIPAAVAGGDLPWWQFRMGSYVQIAKAIGGLFLQTLVLISAVGTTLMLHVSGTYCQAFELSGMADNDLVPQVLNSRNKRFRSPHVAIFTSWVAVVLLSAFDFEQLLAVNNILACAAEMLIVVAGIRLRFTLPSIPRPIKVPGGVAVLVAVAMCVSLVLCGLAYTALDDSVKVAVLLGGLTPGLLYGCYDKYLRKQYVQRA